MKSANVTFLLFAVMATAAPFTSSASAQTAFVPSAVGGLKANLIENIARPIRYRPEGGDFVIDNGLETFNRPLYGGNTFFRVDGGDKPEFVFYLPGRGGNLRLAIVTPAGIKWLHEAANIRTRYRPGELIYDIKDPLLGGGTLRVEAVAYAVTEGLALRIEGSGLPTGVDLVWAYGGINGQRGGRDGDIGTERVPISQWFHFKPEFAADNRVTANKDGFTVAAPKGVVVSASTGNVRTTIADAAGWGDAAQLLASGGATSDRPVALGRVALATNKPCQVGHYAD